MRGWLPFNFHSLLGLIRILLLMHQLWMMGKCRDTADGDIEMIALPENHPFAVKKKVGRDAIYEIEWCCSGSFTSGTVNCSFI